MGTLHSIRDVDSAPVAVPSQEGKSLMRRKYQQGYAVQKNRKKSDPVVTRGARKRALLA